MTVKDLINNVEQVKVNLMFDLDDGLEKTINENDYANTYYLNAIGHISFAVNQLRLCKLHLENKNG